MPQTTRSPFLISILALSAVLIGCSEDNPATDDTGGSESGEAGDGDGDSELQPTWWQDVAPIYYESCVGCHREGGIGPFRLDTYESAATWGHASSLAVDAGIMPPFLVTDDGTCNSWQHSPVLSQEQIDTIAAWVEADTPEGTPRDDLELPESDPLPNTTSFSTPEFVPMPEGGPLLENDEYRCFLIDPALEHDVFMTGYEVNPGNDALVHHLLGMTVDPNGPADVEGMTNMQVMQALDDESPDRLGWPCLNQAGDGVDIAGGPVNWAPGQGAVQLPSNSGFRIRAGELLVMQIHYNMYDQSLIGQSDSTIVELQLVDEVEREGLFDGADGLIPTLYEGEPHVIPVGEAAHEYSWRMSADWWIGWQGSEELELWGFLPHMHTYGTTLRARVLDENGQELACVGEVPRWDFHWQLYYFMEQPIMLEPGYEIEVTCTYDTRTAPVDLMPGWGTFNEMCFMGLYLLAP